MAEARLLLVEDEDDLRMLVGEALRLLGFSVAAVSDGVAAVAALEQERFDVVVSDVSMPNGMSGIDLVGHAARLQPDSRIILVSGYARAQLPSLPGNVVFLPKPYRIAQLAELLREKLAVGGRA